MVECRGEDADVAIDGRGHEVVPALQLVVEGGCGVDDCSDTYVEVSKDWIKFGGFDVVHTFHCFVESSGHSHVRDRYHLDTTCKLLVRSIQQCLGAWLRS